MSETPLTGKEDFLDEASDNGQGLGPVSAVTDGSVPSEIYSGDVLSQADLNCLLRQQSPKIVALVGEQDAGKTTLLASLYGQFCRGRIGDFSFAGSKTLVGFAKRYHLALVSSGLDQTKTPRTSRNDPVAYFHLAVRCKGEALRNLVVSDRSGEVYEAARTDTSLISELSEFKVANRVVFLLDASRISALETRANYSRQFKQMVHALNDNGAFDSGAEIEVLTTKIDFLEAQTDSVDRFRRVSDYENTIKSEFLSSGFNIGCFRICALPKAKPSIGFVGLSDLMQRWTAILPTPKYELSKVSATAREIDKLVGR